jgi:hypothetical protein
VHAPAELAAAYWEQHRRGTSTERAVRLSQDDVFWAWEEINERVIEQPEDVVEVLVIIAEAAPDDAALAYLGAGPVEALLHPSVSTAVIDRVEHAAIHSEAFRKALRCAWFDGQLSPDVAARLRRFGDQH